MEKQPVSASGFERNWFAVILVIVGLVIGFSLLFSSTNLEKSFALPDTSGKLVFLENFAGKPIVVIFFSPRCGECVEEVPILKELYQQYHDKVNFIAVGIKYENEIRHFVKEHEIPFPVVIDTSLLVSKRFKVHWLPRIVIFDGNGKIIFEHESKLEKDAFEEAIQKAL
jgi:peroxiredoxin